MVDVKNNFKNKYDDMLCPLCKTEEEDQFHLFNCVRIVNNCHDLAENIEVEYEDIFSPVKKKIEKAAQLLMKIWEVREKMLKN